MLTFQEEVNIIWRSKISKTSLLFICIRYTVILGQIVEVFIAYSEVSRLALSCEGIIAKPTSEVCKTFLSSGVRNNTTVNANRSCYNSQLVTTIIQMLVTVELAGKFGFFLKMRPHLIDSLEVSLLCVHTHSPTSIDTFPC